MLKSKSEIEGFKSRLKQYRLAKSEDSLLNYWDYMTKLSSKKAKDWLENEDITLTLMLNDNTYNYKEFYDKDKEQAMKMLTADSEAHFTDVGKTVYHPTFSNESSYSGKVSEFNPRGTVGGSWKGEDYYVSPSLILNNDYNYSKTRDYLNKAGGKDGKIFIPKYADGTEGITDHETYRPKEVEMNQKLYDINHTDLSTGIKSPFYNSADNTYGTVPLEGLEVTAPLTKKAINATLARRGRKAYHEGAKTAFKLAAPLVAGAGLASMAGAGLLSTAINPVDAAFIATDPTLPLNYLPFVGQSTKYLNKMFRNLDFDTPGFKLKSDPLKEGATPINNKIKIENIELLSGNINNTKYLDYGDIPFGYNIGEETPLYIRNVKNFYNDDVNYRESLLDFKPKIFDVDRSYNTFGNTKVNVREYLDDVDYFGYAGDDGIVISKSGELSPDETLVHEGTHIDLYLNRNKNIYDNYSAYSKENTELLLDAYNFNDSFLEKNNVNLLLEKGATNRENRYIISKYNNNVTKKELDNIINDMSDDEIGYMMMRGNAYSRSFWKYILEKNKPKSQSVKSIKRALIGVPSLIPAYLNTIRKEDYEQYY